MLKQSKQINTDLSFSALPRCPMTRSRLASAAPYWKWPWTATEHVPVITEVARLPQSGRRARVNALEPRPRPARSRRCRSRGAARRAGAPSPTTTSGTTTTTTTCGQRPLSHTVMRFFYTTKVANKDTVCLMVREYRNLRMLRTLAAIIQRSSGYFDIFWYLAS